MVVQLIQNLVWILLSGESMDPLKPFEWYHHVCTKPMGIFESGHFSTVSNGLSVGGVKGNTVCTWVIPPGWGTICDGVTCYIRKCTIYYP